METEDWECDVCGVRAKVPAGSEPPQHNCRPRGLGDVIAKGLKKMGVTKERTSRVKQILTGNDYAECGCKGRQEWLNTLWSFDNSQQDNIDIEMPYYTLEDEARMGREALCRGVRVWSYPSEGIESIVTSPLYFSESRFFGVEPDLSYLSSYDIDGIFLEDIFPSETGLHGKEYEQVLISAGLINIVKGVDVKLITGRHPRYRDVTEAWFKESGMNILTLDMYTGNEFESEKHGKFKSIAYAKSNSMIYIESCPDQAKEVYDSTLKTVICPAIKKVLTNREQLHLLQKEI